eukprot:TRINITY_DN7572_c0_g1_i6.p1 TRINITY_DN7572_c0_g1~~TRINITY_DN7572_c0_g1_i6.p1  ORF type:complete len:654 (-),score=96.60 TRINITY_DN7572_c0_g1_i6:126-2087(-)
MRILVIFANIYILSYYLSSSSSSSSCSFFVSGAPFADDDGALCEAYEGISLANTGEWCSPYIHDTSSIFTSPAIGSQYDRDEDVFSSNVTSPSTLGFTILTSSTLPPTCMRWLLLLQCNTLYPHCKTITTGGGNDSTPLRPCKNVCMQVNKACLKFFSAYYWKSLDCNMKDDEGYDVWPSYNSNDVDDDRCLFHDEAIPPTLSSNILIQPTCPFPFVKNESSSGDPSSSPCALLCPDPVYSKDEWGQVVKLTNIPALLSVLLDSIIIVIFLLHPKRRQFPSRLHIHLFFSTLILSISLLIGGWNPHLQKDEGGSSHWCQDSVTWNSSQSSRLCALQGFSFLFSALSACAWCMIIAFNLVQVIFRGGKVRDMVRFEKFYILVAWVMPLTCAITAISLNFVKAGKYIGFCFIYRSGWYGGVIHSGGGDGPPPPGTYFSGQFAFLYIPAILCLGTCLIMLIAVCIKLIKHARNSVASQRGTWRRHIRIIVFSFIMIWMVGLAVIFRYISDGSVSADGEIKWKACKMQHALGMIKGDDCTSSTPSVRTSLAAALLQAFSVSSLGVLIFICFGSDWDLYVFMAAVLRALFTCNKTALVSLVNYGESTKGSYDRSEKTGSAPTTLSKEQRTPEESQSMEQQHHQLASFSTLVETADEEQ